MSTSQSRILGGACAALGLAALAGSVALATAHLVPQSVPGRWTASVMMLGLLLVLGGGMTLLGHRN